ncbi:MAG: hypothetical protein ABR611_14555, partial [Chthoniobacterales bacterium]
MKHSYLSCFAPAICLILAARLAAEEPKTEKPKQFICVLRLVPRLHSDSAWTKEDNMVLSRH